MAVVQISRIQIRRGKAQSGTGIPQLASGEMAWAIDTQELFIGNGSVFEGAPGVGNTKILTTNDFSVNSNFLGLVQYVYKAGELQTGAGSTSVTRTLQERLDDQVTTVDFAAVGNYDERDGSGADDTSALQRAIDQLYLNAISPAWNQGPDSGQARVILKIPAGTYKLTSTLYIPSYTSLIGDGAESTIIYYDPVSTIVGTTANENQILLTTSAASNMIGASITGPGLTGTLTVLDVVVGDRLILSDNATADHTDSTYTITLAGAAIQFVNDSSTSGNPSTLGDTSYTTQPRNIQLSGLSIKVPTGQNAALQLDAVRESLFEDLTLTSNWDSVTPNVLSKGILMQSFAGWPPSSSPTDGVATANNIFRNIKINGFYYSVYAKQDIVNNIFEDCYVSNTRQGFVLGEGANGTTLGQQYGPRQTQIVNCKFYNVRRHGVLIDRGVSNTVRDCKFNNVGKDGASSIDTTYPQVYFKNHGNVLVNMQSDRLDDLSDPTTASSYDYVPEFAGHGVYQSFGTKAVFIDASQSDSVIRLPVSTNEFGVPLGTIVYTMDYVYKSNATYTDTYTRAGTITIVADIVKKRLQLSDTYDITSLDPTNTIALQLEFSARFLDANGVADMGPGHIPHSINLLFSNDIAGDIGYFNFSYTAMV